VTYAVRESRLERETPYHEDQDLLCNL